MKTAESLLRSYADVVVGAGVNLQQGQRLMIAGMPAAQEPVAAMIAEAAYSAGAQIVETLWSSDMVTLARFRHAPESSFDTVPRSYVSSLDEASREGAAFVLITDANPDLLMHEDAGRVARHSKAMTGALRSFSQRLRQNQVPWTTIALPNADWALKVFPDLEPAVAAGRLWRDVYAFSRADADDPIGAWRDHVRRIMERKRLLTERRYRELRFAGPGTSLRVGMPDRHVWNGGAVRTPGGLEFSPNIPTEEVFSMPHRERVNGTVRATRPLYRSGVMVERIELTLENGRITRFDAASGRDYLESILGTDDGAVRLGEVALVPMDSPIAASGRVYHNALIDENAGAHLAIGLAYRYCIEGGDTMSPEDFSAAGGNVSSVHIDFTIGSKQLDVFGVRADGSEEPVLSDGLWAI